MVPARISVVPNTTDLTGRGKKKACSTAKSKEKERTSRNIFLSKCNGEIVPLRCIFFVLPHLDHPCLILPRFVLCIDYPWSRMAGYLHYSRAGGTVKTTYALRGGAEWRSGTGTIVTAAALPVTVTSSAGKIQTFKFSIVRHDRSRLCRA